MKLEYVSEDELKLIGTGFEAEVYLMGRGEAEAKVSFKNEDKLTAQKAAKKADAITKKIAKKLTKFDCDTVHFIAEKGTFLNEAYEGAQTVHLDYSEYMMKWQYDGTESLENEAEILLRGSEEDDTDGEMKDSLSVNSAVQDLFSAKLMPYMDGMYVYEVLVKEGCRRQGHGYKYMHSIMNSFKEAPLYLQVGSKNVPACGLYRKLGFEVAQELCYYTIQA